MFFFRWANGRFWWLGWLVGWWSPSSLCAPAPPIEYQIRISLPPLLLYFWNSVSFSSFLGGAVSTCSFFSLLHVHDQLTICLFKNDFHLSPFPACTLFLENLRGIYPAFLALDSRPNGQGKKNLLFASCSFPVYFLLSVPFNGCTCSFRNSTFGQRRVGQLLF